jgi:hypothetical protein
MVGQILQENSVMLSMCRELGFKVKAEADDRGLCVDQAIAGSG